MENRSVNTLLSNVGANQGERLDPQNLIEELAPLMAKGYSMERERLAEEMNNPVVALRNQQIQWSSTAPEGLRKRFLASLEDSSVECVPNTEEERKQIEVLRKIVATLLPPPPSFVRFQIELPRKLYDSILLEAGMGDKTLPEHDGNQTWVAVRQRS
jgi:hypothetical protein